MRGPRRGLLIFDLDGTLFRTDICSVRALESVFRERGLPAPPADEWIDCFGMAESGFIAWLERYGGEGRGPALLDEIAGRELAMVPFEGELYPGVTEALGALRERVEQMAICSNGPGAYVRTVVASMGLEHLFDAVRWRQEGDEDKAGMVAELLGRLSARPAIVIGDRADDIAAAHANGAAAIGTAYGFGKAGELEEAEVVIASPGELPATVSRLLSCDQGSDG
ncbi:MAG: HAD family hydrolase [Armatimonadota bacterium]